MGRPRNPVPTVRLHADGRRAVCDFYDPGSGKKRMCVLGPWGSEAADAAYRRLLADLAAGRTAAPPGGITVAELCVRFLAHAKAYYVGADGRATSEVDSYRLAVACLVEAAGDVPAAGFGPKLLLAARDRMLLRGWTRQNVNAQAGRVRRVFRWAAEAELVPAAVWSALAAVKGLGKGRSPARESEPVAPATAWQVGRTLPRLPPAVAAMVRLGWHTGCRPQDACNLRAADLDRSGDVWAYRVPAHKGAWRGKARVVFVGPRAQAVLAPWLGGAADGPVFTHRSGGYTTSVYCKAVRRGCEAAGVEPFTPGQLRHSAAVRVRERFGLEAAQHVLGHERMQTTEIYATRSARLAAEVMRKAG